jgi:hypothetical protein
MPVSGPARSLSNTSRHPFDGIDLVLIDGNNLLYRQSGGTGDAAVRGLLVDLQRKLPAGVRAAVVLDGHPAPGTPRQQRISGALDVRQAGSQSADDAIVAEITGQPWSARARTIVVTDDRALADRSRTAGALTRRLDWLAALPTAPSGPVRAATIGAGRPPRLDRRGG